MDKFGWLKRACTLFLICVATAIALPAQTFTTLHIFQGPDGDQPRAGLAQGTDGNLYGTTVGVDGTVFKITPSGTLTTLYKFCSQSGCTDGDQPFGGLVQATDGSLYGTTYQGGANGSCNNGCGTVFKITPSGALTTLYSFCSESGCQDGSKPYAALVQATDGSFYGTTSGVEGNGSGTVQITPTGTLTTLYTFCSQSGCTDGMIPQAALVQATDGNLYGTTSSGGTTNFNCPFGCGTIFKITPSGALTTLHSFCSQSDCGDGAGPTAALVQASDGNFYGAAPFGGLANSYGTVFKITPSGTLTTLHSFNGADGAQPYAALAQATDGNLYGTTAMGGFNGLGTVFRITPRGTLTTLHSFCSQSACADGDQPLAALAQDTNGNLYGTTYEGSRDGTVFSLSVGLGPFAETQPRVGKVGKPVRILGTNLTGATSVTFNGTPAAFKVVLNSAIAAIVPAGATSGTVQVVTPSGTLSSNVPFIVRP